MVLPSHLNRLHVYHYNLKIFFTYSILIFTLYSFCRFATLPRQPRPRSTRHIEKKLLEDRLDLLLSNEAGSDGSEDNFEVEPGFQDDEEGFQDDAEGFQEDAEGFNEDIENSTVDRKSSGDNDEDDDSGAGSQSLSGNYGDITL